jgi:hypothetical protein
MPYKWISWGSKQSTICSTSATVISAAVPTSLLKLPAAFLN